MRDYGTESIDWAECLKVDLDYLLKLQYLEFAARGRRHNERVDNDDYDNGDDDGMMKSWQRV